VAETPKTVAADRVKILALTVKSPLRIDALVQSLQNPAPRIFAGTVVAETPKTVAADRVKILALTVKSPPKTNVLVNNL